MLFGTHIFIQDHSLSLSLASNLQKLARWEYNKFVWWYVFSFCYSWHLIDLIVNENLLLPSNTIEKKNWLKEEQFCRLIQSTHRSTQTKTLPTFPLFVLTTYFMLVKVQFPSKMHRMCMDIPYIHSLKCLNTFDIHSANPPLTVCMWLHWLLRIYGYTNVQCPKKMSYNGRYQTKINIAFILNEMNGIQFD